jgi:hypothetical protein
MADVFYSVVLGERSPHQVTVGASTSSEAVELRVESAVTGIAGNKGQLLAMVDAIRDYIATDAAPA